MSTNKTQNYQFHQWLPEDVFLRSEFNENFAKLDAALAALAQTKAAVLTGSYTGDGKADRLISLGITPRAVYVADSSGFTATTAVWLWRAGR